MKKVLFAITIFLLQCLMLSAQQTDFMRSIGKIYVVVAVIVVVFLGIVIYLISLDRKLTKLERQIEEND